MKRTTENGKTVYKAYNQPFAVPAKTFKEAVDKVWKA